MQTVRDAPAYPVPDYGLRVLHALEDAGFEAWVVGGWVRDALLGAPMHDVDVTTSAPWQETERVLRTAGIEVHETGTAHGTVTAVIDGQPVEVTTYRVEGTYSDRRHPDEVRFVRDVREDLARRDFTVNAMAYHPDRGLLDLFGGREDLARGVVRAVGDPYRRFEEDALRVLRAVRFACRLGFEVEPHTQVALAACAPELDGIARERVGQEMDGIVASGRVSWALNNEFDVLARAVPALIPMRGLDQRSPYHAYNLLEHTARVCAGVEAFSGGVPRRRSDGRRFSTTRASPCAHPSMRMATGTFAITSARAQSSARMRSSGWLCRTRLLTERQLSLGITTGTSRPLPRACGGSCGGLTRRGPVRPPLLRTNYSTSSGPMPSQRLGPTRSTRWSLMRSSGSSLRSFRAGRRFVCATWRLAGET